MSKAVSLDRIEKCLKSVRRVDDGLKANAFLMQDLSFESIDIIDLLFALEQEFGSVLTMVEFNNYVLDRMKARNAKSWDFTIQELADFLKSRTD